jgi:hypothetical protein
MEFLQIKAKFPVHISFFTARLIIDDFVTDSLEQFEVAPTNEQLQDYIDAKYKSFLCEKYYCLLVELTPQEALNTVSSRSMSSYEAPVHKRKLERSEKENLASFCKKKKNNKVDKICEICQEKLGSTHVYVVPCCDSMFHGSCIRKALEWRDTCPMCYSNLKDLICKKSSQT